jgi:type II secretory ATPase GspE/PulE/Tfp pilus assembly ATPase PilB-like protein
MQSMRDDGLLKALSGTTTIEEVVRVTPEHVE